MYLTLKITRNEKYIKKNSMITKERLKELENSEAKLHALENGGVDNWAYYGDALEDYFKDIQAQEEIEDLLDNIEQTFFEGAYEPSERGAGITPTDEARENVRMIIMKYLETK